MSSSSSFDVLSVHPADQSCNPWEPQTDYASGHHSYANGHTNGNTSFDCSLASNSTSPSAPDPHTLFAAISLRAFALGSTLSASLLLAAYLIIVGYTPLWRLPCFLTALSLFHFLEYYITARYNPTAATVSAFLLSQNGKAYNIAHGMAFLECALHWSLAPGWYPMSLRPVWLALGFVMLAIGQSVRTAAMAKAGKSFSHQVQLKRKAGHELVTDGIYGYLRHPSYFGFFWWGLGTQVVLGNAICLLGYAFVLWKFFSRRIRGELLLSHL
ncbi:hypothetical protein MMC21_004356 [Puttea exsequens]|nr:hypothetical protein [Puttea exsequens]